MSLCSEKLAFGVKTVWSDRALFVASVSWLVTLVTWDFHLIVLNHVLLDNGLTIAKSRGLVCGKVVVASLWNEPIVAWYVRGCFGCANS